MKINWRVRVRSKAWLSSMLAAAASFAYQLASLLGLTPPVEQAAVMDAIAAVLSLLTALGVVMDPTTPGLSDSDRAMTY